MTANYYIKCANRDRDGDVESVGVGQNVDGKYSSNTKQKREVIEDIDGKGKTVQTVYSLGGEWVVGSEVHTVDRDYIRTDRNNTRADNLDNIPEC